MDRGVIGNMGITNNNDRAVEFKIEMRSQNKQPQCKQSCPGMMNKFTLESPATKTNTSTPGTNTTTPETNTTSPLQKKTQCYKLNIRRRENI
jgi:hypothetical protein